MKLSKDDCVPTYQVDNGNPIIITLSINSALIPLKILRDDT